jgi:hypothetical protein
MVKSSRKCPPGMITRVKYTRKAFTRKSGVRVHGSKTKSACIENRGNPGKGPVLFTLDPEDHYLSEHGYENVDEMSIDDRKKALMYLIKDLTPMNGYNETVRYVIRALNARYILNRNTNRKTARIFKSDQRMISKLYKKTKIISKK